MRTLEEIKADINKLNKELETVYEANKVRDIALLNSKYANNWIIVHEHTSVLDAGVSKIIKGNVHLYKVKEVLFQGQGFFRFSAILHIKIDSEDNEKLTFLVEKDLDNASIYFSDFKRELAKIVNETEISKWLNKAKNRFNHLFALAKI